MKVLQGRVKVCPNCSAQDVRLSRRRWFDYFVIVFLILPYRSGTCVKRFWPFA